MNPLGAISGILPLLIILPLLSNLGGSMGGKKKNYLMHSEGRNIAKDVLGAVGILGGLGACVAAPIVFAVVKPAVNSNDASITTLAELQANQADWNRAFYAGDLTASISAGVGLVVEGIGEILAKA